MRPPLLAHLVVISMLAVVIGVALRWSVLDRGAKWIGGGVGVFLAYSFVALSLSLAGMSTRVFQEGPFLVGTTCHLVGMMFWQPTVRSRRIVAGLAILFAVAWVVAQYLQGAHAEFSHLSAPLHAAVLTAAAGFTLVNRIRVSWERWTQQVWFWFCIGLMLVYGTDVVLTPLVAGMFRVRNDLVLAAAYLHLAASVVGYVLMTWALWAVAKSVQGPKARDPLAGAARQLL